MEMGSRVIGASYEPAQSASYHRSVLPAQAGGERCPRQARTQPASTSRSWAGSSSRRRAATTSCGGTQGGAQSSWPGGIEGDAL